jgi:plasmid stabilization system protein ParE
MPQVKLSVRAREDLRRPYGFLAEKDAGAAGRALEAIEVALLTVEKFPSMYWYADEESELRELVIEFGSSSYLALYFWDEIIDVIIVLAVKHQLENDYGLDHLA